MVYWVTALLEGLHRVFSVSQGRGLESRPEVELFWLSREAEFSALQFQTAAVFLLRFVFRFAI